MLRHVAAFEWRYQVKSPVFWVGSLIFFLLTYGSVTVDEIQIGARGNVHLNSPYAILQTVATMSIFAVFVMVAMVAGTVLRDDETGFAPMLRATRLGKGSYLVGRYLGALGAALLVVASIPLAVLVGSWMPWLDPEKLGPLRLIDYAYALFAFALPTLLVISAALFALAVATRSMMWSYVATVGAVMLYLIMRGLLRDPKFDTFAALADPFGLSALSITTRYWTAAERNTLLPPLAGLLLWNRLLWAAVGAALFALAYRLFRFETVEGRAGKRRREEAADDGAPAAATPPATPRALPAPRTGLATRLAQLWLLARHDMAYVFRSPAFFVLLGMGLLNAGGAQWYTGEYYGSPAYPVTRLMVQTLWGAYTLIPIIIAIYYAGELVWRDRERRMHEIVDATAAPDWTHLLPKIVAITLVLAGTALVGVAGSMLVQTAKGYFRYDLAAYLLWFALPMTVVALQLAVLSVLAQVLVPQKYIGWGLMLLYLVASVAFVPMGLEHNLYNYAGVPVAPLSDMNRMGRFWIGQAWLQVYWSAFALALAVLAHALWRRGTTVALQPRLAQLRQRLHGGAMVWLTVGLVGWIAAGAWVFANTNLLNRYVTVPEREALLAKIEKELLPYENVPKPRITAVQLDVQIYPREAKATTRGRYTIENRTAQPIPVLHLAWGERLKLDRVDLPGATLEREWPEYHYRIYRLSQPLQPGERRALSFATTLEERGFPNSAPLVRVVENGSFIDNTEITPMLGLSRQVLLKDRSKRRKHGLPADLRFPKLEDESARANNALRSDSDWVDAEITVTTDADQTPIAPGYVQSDTTAKGRRTVRFKSDAPINHFFSVQSARYAVQRDRWQDVSLAVFYHPGHEYNVPRMLAAMKLSLEMFSQKFSPFQFRQARIIEFPSYADFAQSFANTIPYSENIGFLANHQDPEKIDMVTYVTAHEIAHQWWAHQLLPSEQEGATMLIESLSQYSAVLVMERMYGREQVRRFLKYELDRYLRARGGEVVEEVPLARVEDQPYIHYQKGTLAMLWLREVVGEDTVNRALAQMLKTYAFKPAPYPNTRDFLKLLRTEAGPQHDALITDLFEKITLLDLKASEVQAKKRPDGKYEVTLQIEARKLYADGKGVETEAPLDEVVDIGVFSAEPGKAQFKKESVLLFERRPIKSGKQTLVLVVDKLPTHAGVDPYNKRIDRDSNDNLKAVEAK